MNEADRAEAVAAVKALLRIGNDAEDGLIGTLVEEALSLAEHFTGLVPIVREVREQVRADGAWRRLIATPVLAVTGVEGVPVDQYAVDNDADGDGWVRVGGPNRVATVTLTAGLATGWTSLPAGFAGGVVRMAAHRFDARGDEVPPASVAALWRPWRRMRLAERGCA